MPPGSGTRPRGGGFSCAGRRPSADEEACARKIVTLLARRAYRQPPSALDLDTLLSFYQNGRKDGGFDAGIEQAVSRVLADPRFVFRFEREPENVPAGHPYRMSDLELAIAAVVLFVEQHPRRRTAGRGDRRTSCTIRRCSKRRRGACWRIRKSETLVTEFRRSMAVPARAEKSAPRGEGI